ncbi:MAG: hypothetical protein JG776_445 [Caloramator sp.]|jgi:hypothetical protein|uniref:DUF6711 family protein n=1 Tax=Caloramator sp. TaxID=1871330 RepID=UPI001DEC25AC|nr:DUF6711 family protein [Caloramator sp.]MBZ4662763.1 hypothetical protein [Caloramator sp.]
MLKINGQTVKSPSIFRYSLYDIDGESNRNLKGELIRDRIATKVKLDLEWSVLTMSEISTILNATSNVFFTVEYPDAKAGQVVTKTFYVGDRTAPLFKVDGNNYVWEGLKLSLIEK